MVIIIAVMQNNEIRSILLGGLGDIVCRETRSLEDENVELVMRYTKRLPSTNFLATTKLRFSFSPTSPSAVNI